MNVKTFPYLIEKLENIFGNIAFSRLILSEDFYQNIPISHIELQQSHAMRIFFSRKKTKLPLLSPTTTHRRLPLAASRVPSAKGIFENVQNIFGNSIYLPNALKTHAWDSYSREQYSWKSYS